MDTLLLIATGVMAYWAVAILVQWVLDERRTALEIQFMLDASPPAPGLKSTRQQTT